MVVRAAAVDVGGAISGAAAGGSAAVVRHHAVNPAKPAALAPINQPKKLLRDIGSPAIDALCARRRLARDQSGCVRLDMRQRGTRTVVAGVCVVFVERYAVTHGYTDNLLWLPSGVRSTMLLAVVGCALVSALAPLVRITVARGARLVTAS